MDRNGVADHVWSDHGAARPGLDDVLGVLLVLKIYLFRQMRIHKRTLFQTTWHEGLLSLLVLWTTADNLCIASFLLSGATFRLTPR